MNAFLPLLKPPGITSHTAVQRVRRAFGERAGHLGTLDPDAAGVLVVAVGEARRVLRYLPAMDKVYRAEIWLGARTSTDDDQGTCLESKDSRHITSSQVESWLVQHVGSQMQVPPAVSAVQVSGRRLYAYARAGQTVEVPARSVQLFAARVEDFRAGERARARVWLHTSSGFYVRSLARDLGAHLGVGGHMGFLLRLQVGHWSVEKAVALHELDTFVASALLEDLRLPAVEVDDAQARIVRHGGCLDLHSEAGLSALVYRGCLLAVAESDGQTVKPRTVLSLEGGV